MKINLSALREREKFINETRHPRLNLIIWNYSQECQFARAWDKYTEQCRGLITDLEGNIVARPFKKFFNYGEDIKLNIPTDMPIISEKMDGSLGIQYYDGDKVYIATRGSFSSDQANWGTHFMNEVCNFTRKDFIPNKTYLYEIIYPENRIVVDYHGRNELVLLAIIDNETGDETYTKNNIESEAFRLGIHCAQRIKVNNIGELIEKTKALPGNEEGFVMHWPHEGNLRLKIKGPEYVRLHKLLTEFSSISIWECLKEKQELYELLDNVPDEFFNWVKETKDKLIAEYTEIFDRAKKAWVDVAVLPTRKDQALKVQEKYSDISGLVFSMLGEKDPSPMIWKMIRPRYEKPFAKGIEE